MPEVGRNNSSGMLVPLISEKFVSLPTAAPPKVHFHVNMRIIKHEQTTRILPALWNSDDAKPFRPFKRAML